MSTTPRPPLKGEREPLSKSLQTAFKKLAKGAGWLVAICLLTAAGISGWQWLDENGYVPHDRTLDVSMTGDWLIGENRTCQLIQEHDASGKATGQLIELECPIGDKPMETHNIAVTFKGVVTPVDFAGDTRTIADLWQCTRGNWGGFTCVVVSSGNAQNP